MKHERKFAWTIYSNKKVVNGFVGSKIPGTTSEHIDLIYTKEMSCRDVCTALVILILCNYCSRFFCNYVNHDLHTQ